MDKIDDKDEDSVENLVRLSLSFGMAEEYLEILNWNVSAIERSFVRSSQCESCGKVKRSHTKKAKDDKSDDTRGRIKKILSIAKIDEKRIVSFD
jgi:hypothetical protein